jgi:hypothetical protein
MCPMCKELRMKCNREFILAYNRLFDFLTKNDSIDEFWPLLSDAVLGRLRFLVEQKGVAGMIEYWSDTLLAEDADCTLIANTKNPISFEIIMRECPSLKKISDAGETITPGYCNHCEKIYAPLLKECGYSYESIGTERGCVIRIRELV